MTNETPCLKCGGERDKGRITNNAVSYASNRSPRGIFAPFPTIALSARACLNCGYVEMYLDAMDLAEKIPQG